MRQGSNSLHKGILLILISLVIMVNYGYIGRIITYFACLAFGFYAFVIAVILFVLGIFTICKLTYKSLLSVIGVLIIILTLMVFTTYQGNINLTNFAIAYNNAKSQIAERYVSYLDAFSYLKGGAIGYFFTGLLNTIFGVSAKVFLYIFFALGCLLVIFKPLISFIKFLKKINNDEKKLAPKKEAVVNEIIEEKITLSPEEDVHKETAFEDDYSSLSLDEFAQDEFKENVTDDEENNIDEFDDVKEAVEEEKTEPIQEEIAHKKVVYNDLFSAFNKNSSSNKFVEDTKIKNVVVTPLDNASNSLVTPKEEHGVYQLPPLDLLNANVSQSDLVLRENKAKEKMELLNKAFVALNKGAKAISYTIGPSVTSFEIALDDNVTTNILNPLEEDLARRLGGNGNLRIVNVIEGKSTSAIEVENDKHDIVYFKDVMQVLNDDHAHNMAIPLGKDILGKVVYSRLDKMPHLLISGTTGSGKSVLVHNIITALLMRNTVEELRFILIDKKRVEFARYNGVPHLLCPVINTVDSGRIAIKRLREEMERRYTMFAEVDGLVNNYEEYMALAKEKNLPTIPRIVMVLDEYADFIIDAPDREVEKMIQSLAQMARAAGIHMIICTQHPSVKVISSETKSNFPYRIALKVTQGTTSRVILDEGGAERLVGNGDMLALLPNMKGLVRLQSAYIANEEINRVVQFIKNERTFKIDPNFDNLYEVDALKDLHIQNQAKDYHYDEKFLAVKEYVLNTKICSSTKIATTFEMAIGRAECILDTLEQDGYLIKDGRTRRVIEENFEEEE